MTNANDILADDCRNTRQTTKTKTLQVSYQQDNGAVTNKIVKDKLVNGNVKGKRKSVHGKT